MSDDKPTWQPLWLACKVCGHIWDGWQPCNVPIPVWIATIDNLRCPRCGVGPERLTLRTKPLPPGFVD